MENSNKSFPISDGPMSQVVEIKRYQHDAKRTELTARGLKQINIRNNFAALVTDLPAPSSLGLLVSVTAVLTPTTLTAAVASLSRSASFPLSGSDGAWPAVGGLELTL